MAKNEAVTVTYTAWDTAANVPKTGDVANHAIRYLADGVAATPAASPVEGELGEYKIAIAAGENTGAMMAIIGESSTSNIIIVKASWQNADRNALADALLSRNVSNVEGVAAKPSLALVILALYRSNTVDNDGNLTVYQTDGSTEFTRLGLTTDQVAKPITGTGE